MQDVCEKAKGGQSHTAHRVVAFEPYAPAALFLRIAVTALVVSHPSNKSITPSLSRHALPSKGGGSCLQCTSSLIWRLYHCQEEAIVRPRAASGLPGLRPRRVWSFKLANKCDALSLRMRGQDRPAAACCCCCWTPFSTQHDIAYTGKFNVPHSHVQRNLIIIHLDQ